MLCAITTVAFSSFRVGGRNDLSQNLENTLTMIFTAAAFRFSLEGKLPVVNYLTVLDKYLLLTIVFMIIIVAMLVRKSDFSRWKLAQERDVRRLAHAQRCVCGQEGAVPTEGGSGACESGAAEVDSDGFRKVGGVDPLTSLLHIRIQSTSRLSHMLRASTHVFVRAGCEYDLAAATYRVPLPLHLRRLVFFSPWCAQASTTQAPSLHHMS